MWGIAALFLEVMCSKDVDEDGVGGSGGYWQLDRDLEARVVARV